MELTILLIGIVLIAGGLYSHYLYYRRSLEEKGECTKELLVMLDRIDRKMARLLKEFSSEEAFDGDIVSETAGGEKAFPLKGEFASLLEESCRRENEETARNGQQSGRGKQGVIETGKYAQVMELAGSGLDGEQIAERLDLGIRETELLLKFQQREKKEQ